MSISYEQAESPLRGHHTGVLCELSKVNHHLMLTIPEVVRHLIQNCSSTELVQFYTLVGGGLRFTETRPNVSALSGNQTGGVRGSNHP